MRKIARMCMIALVAAFSTTMTLTSCDERTMEVFVESVNLIGTWQSMEEYTPVSDPSSSIIRYSGVITFRSNHTFIDNYGEGTWALRDRILTLNYEGRYGEMVQLTVKDGYTPYVMKLNTTVVRNDGRPYWYTLTLTNR